MKKFLALLLTVVMLASVCLFASAESADDVWYVSMYGMNVTLTLKADGTYAMSTGDLGDMSTGTWEKDDTGAYTLTDTEGASVHLAPDGETLICTDEGAELTFTREPADVFEAPETVEVADVAELNGTYDLHHVVYMGMTLDTTTFMEELGGEAMGISSSSIVIDAGNVDMMGMGSTAMTFENGALTVSNEDSGLTITISKTADGGVVVDLMGMLFYASPVAQ